MGLLRLILALAVVVAHSKAVCGFKFTGGVVAVEAFFIISGFYMSMILDKKYTGKGSYALFLSNRFLRLYPVFWTVLLLTLLISILSGVFIGNWRGLSSYVQYFDVMTNETFLFQVFTNLALFGQDIVMFLGFNQDTGGMYFTPDFRTSSPMLFTFLLVPQAWTLGVELMFYMIAPFLVRKSNLFVILIIALSLSIRICTYSLGYTNDPWTYRFFPSELALFLLGTVSYRLYSVYKIQEFKIFNVRPIAIVSIFLFISIIFYQFIPRAFGVAQEVVNWSFYGFVCLSIPYLFSFTKSSRIDSRIGELSYPIYISHVLVITVISPFLSKVGWQEHFGEWAIAFTILVSYILVRLISDPIEKVRQARVKRANETVQ